MKSVIILELAFSQFETLGDAQYMVVNGIPVRKDQHVEPVAAMALDILQIVNELKDPCSGEPLTVTIGRPKETCRSWEMRVITFCVNNTFLGLS